MGRCLKSGPPAFLTMISVIIPIYNEEETLRNKSSYFRELAKHSELIFVDGGSSDRGANIAREYSSVLYAKKERALQMNYGANLSEKDILLFLHADTHINIDTLISVENKLSGNEVSTGCLTQRIDKNGLIYRLIEGLGNLRAKVTGVFYGDQGIFIKRALFNSLGGFPDVPVMEDVIFTRALRKITKPIVLRDKIFVSPRRWEKDGVIKTVFLYSFINTLFWLGFPLDKIKKAYSDLR